MNCKPGDLAILVKANFKENLGKVCQVLAIEGEHYVAEFPSPVRWVAGNGRTVTARRGLVVRERLRPLRDSDGSDETLSWAGKPQAVKHQEAA